MKSSTAIVQEVPTCLCQQIMHRKPGKPELRYAANRKEYIIWCQPAITGLILIRTGNRLSLNGTCQISSGNKHIEDMWLKRYLK